MERTAVRSTEIAIVGYDQSSKKLEIAFRTGSVYHYEDVPQEIYEGLIRAKSVGTYFAEYVKNTYSYVKMH